MTVVYDSSNSVSCYSKSVSLDLGGLASPSMYHIYCIPFKKYEWGNHLFQKGRCEASVCKKNPKTSGHRNSMWKQGC